MGQILLLWFGESIFNCHPLGQQSWSHGIFFVWLPLFPSFFSGSCLGLTGSEQDLCVAIFTGTSAIYSLPPESLLSAVSDKEVPATLVSEKPCLPARLFSCM